MILLFSIFFACKPERSSSFSVSSNSNVNTFEDSDASNDDFADTAEDMSVEEDSVAPEIRNITAFFLFSETDPPRIEVHVRVDDWNDDLMNGSVEMSYATESNSYEFIALIDGVEAIFDSGNIYFLIEEGVDNDLFYTLSVVISDEAGNSSLPYMTELAL